MLVMKTIYVEKADWDAVRAKKLCCSAICREALKAAAKKG